MQLDKSDHDLLVEIHTTLTAMAATVGNHERRIRAIEHYMWVSSGIAVVVGYILRALLR